MHRFIQGSVSNSALLYNLTRFMHPMYYSSAQKRASIPSCNLCCCCW